MKAFVLIIGLLASAQFAAAQDAVKKSSKAAKSAPDATVRLVPPQQPPTAHAALPAGIPEQFSPPQEAYASFPEPAGGAAAAKPSACQERLAKLAAFKPMPLLVGAGECGAVDAVMLDSVTLTDKTKVSVSPPATLRCTMAEQVAIWVRDDVAPLAQKRGSQLRMLDNFDSYECRGRNRVRGATLSEHGRANALDVRGFKLANGEMIRLTDVDVTKAWRESVRASACARFSTVLGPGSDGHHEEHIHVDLAERRNGYKTCEWEVREPVKQAAATPPAAAAERPAAGQQAAEAQTAEPQAVVSAAPLSGPIPLPRKRPRAADRSKSSKRAHAQHTIQQHRSQL